MNKEYCNYIDTKEEDLLGYDFQGWPINKINIRLMLKFLGFEKMENEGNTYWRINDDSPLLDMRIKVLEDDGMAYGVNEKWVTESFVHEDKVVLFIDAKDDMLDK